MSARRGVVFRVPAFDSSWTGGFVARNRALKLRKNDTIAGQQARLRAYYRRVVNLLNSNFLFASLLWGSIGVGYCIYGRRQRSIVPFLGGVAMIAVSYFVGSALLMSLLCVALIAGVYFLVKQGY